ncbi:MAG: hypothetical protein IJ150_00170 [Bacteroidales bacterium]|nr:hypothetical protein [Bacteroidales bacterium]
MLTHYLILQFKLLNRTEILLKLKDLNKTILISSHIFSTLSDTCDEILVLRNGIIAETVQRADFQKLEEDLKNLDIKNLVGRLEL